MRIPKSLSVNTQADKHAAEQIATARYTLSRREHFERVAPGTVEQAERTLRYHGLDPAEPAPVVRENRTTEVQAGFDWKQASTGEKNE